MIILTLPGSIETKRRMVYLNVVCIYLTIINVELRHLNDSQCKNKLTYWPFKNTEIS